MADRVECLQLNFPNTVQVQVGSLLTDGDVRYEITSITRYENGLAALAVPVSALKR